jgi:hypothetical protein
MRLNDLIPLAEAALHDPSAFPALWDALQETLPERQAVGLTLGAHDQGEFTMQLTTRGENAFQVRLQTFAPCGLVPSTACSLGCAPLCPASRITAPQTQKRQRIELQPLI